MHTIGTYVERDRLSARAARLKRIIAALHAQAQTYEGLSAPLPLSRSLSDFESELTSIQARLGSPLTRALRTPARMSRSSGSPVPRRTGIDDASSTIPSQGA
jgi:hypothetical protein